MTANNDEIEYACVNDAWRCKVMKMSNKCTQRMMLGFFSQLSVGG